MQALPQRILSSLALLCILLLFSNAFADNRADIATQSLLSKFWSDFFGYLKDKYTVSSSNNIFGLTAYWTYAQGFDVILDAAERNFTQYGHWIPKFYHGQKVRGWNRNFYDDMNWMALCLLRAYSLTKNQEYLSQSIVLYHKIEAALDYTCCGPNPGGIWWEKAPYSCKATAANAGPVVLAARLFKATEDPQYLTFAKTVYQYWWDTMVNKTSYQVCDNISPKRHQPYNVVPDYNWLKYTYNEGLMIGAGVELYSITQDSTYLDHSHKIAQFVLQHETTSNANYSSIITDGNDQQCQGDCHEFKGIAIRYLAALHRVSPKPEYEKLLLDTYESIWNVARDKNNNVFGVDWSQQYQYHKGLVVTQAQTNAAAMALNVITNLFNKQSN